ncbi:MAG: methionine--tRNA ligase [Candidatus Omnitrophota bacterium]|nr:methionine--tRNA ligase [Candidatus Omnitrophota bacterium]
MADKKYYITTPLYYVNAKPHIGHAYTNILCDTFARFRRYLGEDVFFMTGTDEHGTKIEKAARDQNMEPKKYVDEMVPHFKDLWEQLGIQYDYFIRTTDEDHKETVRKVLEDLGARGELYKDNYQGWYSVKSETFYAKAELVDGKCPDTGGEVQEIVEENYFFRMSKYQDWLMDYIRKNPDFIQPEIRRNEILGFLKQPLQDLCITRPKERLSWGIPYPSSPEHVIYVWFDALINYVSGVGYKRNEDQFSRYWPADVHVVGKDIVRHHAVYWPIMLKACGVQMPHKVLAHGWWTLAGAKVSKSSGNIVDPIELIRKYGVDAFRYFLLREVTIGYDGAYSEDLLRQRYTSDLANDLGNLWFRVASMLAKYFGAVVPHADTLESEGLIRETYALWEKVREPMMAYDPRSALEAIWAVITSANQYVEENKPWVLAKDPKSKERLALVLATLTECVAHVAVLLVPFLPKTAQSMLAGLKLSSDGVMNADKFSRPLLRKGTQVERGDALFPRMEVEA